MKIFICEQDPYRAKLMHDILGVYNYKIVTVSRQSDFFREAHMQKPALIVMNDIFAQKSGADILKRMRKDPVTSKIPVIYISSDTPIDENLFMSNVDSLTQFLQEPFKIKNLRHYIDRWTTLRSLYIKH